MSFFIYFCSSSPTQETGSHSADTRGPLVSSAGGQKEQGSRSDMRALHPNVCPGA